MGKKVGHTTVDEVVSTPCFFSKHLAGTEWQRLAQNVKQLGFGGVDLKVGPSEHVLLERAA